MIWRAALAAIALAVAAPLAAEEAQSTLAGEDLRLATIAERLQAANAALCEEQMPLTGLVYHSADQYGSAALETPPFANGALAIAQVLPGSPAADAGLLAGDAITALNGQEVADLKPAEDAPLRDAFYELLARQSANAPLVLTIQRGTATQEVALAPASGCRALVEIITSSGIVGRSDGRVIQISYDFASRLDDDGLAAIFAHELAHVALRHRERLVAAGVRKGLLGEFGRNRRLNRQVEVEADLLSVHLLANAGYDPAIAPTFWRSSRGRSAGGGLLRSGTYPSPAARADMIEREISEFLAGRTGLSWPAHLLDLRDQPF